MSLCRTAAVTVAIAALTLVGCGTENNSTSPADTAPPLAPTAASATARNTRVDVSWNHNSEADLAGYNVYMTGNSGAVKLNDNVLGDNKFEMVVGNEGTYRFRITAVDRSGNESAPSPVAVAQVSLSNPRENRGVGQGIDDAR